MQAGETGSPDRQADLRGRELVLRALRSVATTSRADLVRLTGLGSRAVSDEITALLDAGAVRVRTGTGEVEADVPLELAAEDLLVVGVTLGAFGARARLADGRGDELANVTVTRMPVDGEGLVSLVGEALDLLETPTHSIRHVAVTISGAVDPVTGWLHSAPVFEISDVNFRPALRARLGVPVSVHDTVDAAARAELARGRASGARSAVVLDIGQRASAALIIRGRPYSGAAGHAPNLSHCYVPGATEECWCGRVGCLETVTSVDALRRTVRRFIDNGATTSLADIDAEELTYRDVVAAMVRGDRVARDAVSVAFRYMALGASWLANTFDPEVLVLTGPAAMLPDDYTDAMIDQIREHCAPSLDETMEIVISDLGMEARSVGSVILALEALDETLLAAP